MSDKRQFLLNDPTQYDIADIVELLAAGVFLVSAGLFAYVLVAVWKDDSRPRFSLRHIFIVITSVACMIAAIKLALS